MGISVRSAQATDAELMVALLNPIIRSGRFTIMQDEVSVEDQAAFIREFPKRGVFHVAVRDQAPKILGMQDVVPLEESRVFRHVGLISTFVALDERRQGIGSQLFQSTMLACRASGFSKLQATIRADNPSAIEFYQRQGFRIIGTARKHACVKGIYLDEVLAELLL